MAVYTPVTHQDLIMFLKNYDVGSLIAYEGIEEGVENTNYGLDTENGRFVLTLYEKRVNEEDLPFFLDLMGHYSTHNLPAAAPVAGLDGNPLRKLCGRPAALISFLPGVSYSTPDISNCKSLGRMLARMHLAVSGYEPTRENDLSIRGWKTIAHHCEGKADTCSPGLFRLIDDELATLSSLWPTDMPHGIIHADLFPDNVLFEGTEISGLIDFYFACTDFFTYDLAICLNAWCFESDGAFSQEKAVAMIDAYQALRPFETIEADTLTILLRGAALRFLLTRLYDWLNPVEGAVVNVKDPLEYRDKLLFHRQNNIHSLCG